MKKMTRQAVFRKLDFLYERMASVYEDVATRIGLSCADCEDNCCASYFQHHTYVEWLYLWQGLNKLPEKKRNEYIRRAEDYVHNANALLGSGSAQGLSALLMTMGFAGFTSTDL